LIENMSRSMLLKVDLLINIYLPKLYHGIKIVLYIAIVFKLWCI